MLTIINRIGELKEALWKRVHPPTLVVLHHTGGPTLSSAVSTLRRRGLGYHYLIELDGSVFKYFEPLQPVNHAAGANYNSIGISLVGGGSTLLTDAQIYATIKLVKVLVQDVPSLTHIAGHREVGKKQGKIDPDFKDYEKTMTTIAIQTGLKRVNTPLILAMTDDSTGCC